MHYSKPLLPVQRSSLFPEPNLELSLGPSIKPSSLFFWITTSATYSPQNHSLVHYSNPPCMIGIIPASMGRNSAASPSNFQHHLPASSCLPQHPHSIPTASPSTPQHFPASPNISHAFWIPHWGMTLKWTFSSREHSELNSLPLFDSAIIHLKTCNHNIWWLIFIFFPISSLSSLKPNPYLSVFFLWLLY